MCVVLVNRDLEFIYSIYRKHNIKPPSWYWRLPPESEVEWIDRRVKLCNERNMIEGHLLNDKKYIYYTIPLTSSLCTMHIGHGSTKKTITVPYENLYTTLEELFCE